MQLEKNSNFLARSPGRATDCHCIYIYIGTLKKRRRPYNVGADTIYNIIIMPIISYYQISDVNRLIVLHFLSIYFYFINFFFFFLQLIKRTNNNNNINIENTTFTTELIKLN